MSVLNSLESAVEGLEAARERAKDTELVRLLADIEAEVRDVLEKAREGLLEEAEVDDPDHAEEEAERRWRRREVGHGL